MKSKKTPKKKFDAESLIGGKTGVLKKDKKEYKIQVKSIPECTEACPAGVNVKAYVNLIANRKFEEAVEVIRQANPFPAVCGRVCTRPCEETCILAENGDAISIRDLKRYASDYELARRPVYQEPCKIIHDEKIAVIGAGPAGLTAAVDLINNGYEVSVFEKEKEPGGMLRYGIPAYRLPDRILKREIDWIKSLGVKINTNAKIKSPSSLLKKGFSAVLVAGGAPKSFPLGIEGEKSKGVIDALKFLKQVNEGKTKAIKGNVIVIGGGSTAFDASRSSVRLGAKNVNLVYRRGIEEMPAEEEEIESAKEEGVNIVTLAIPKRIIVKNNKIKSMEFLKAKLVKIDKSFSRSPIPVKDSEFTIDTDILIPAVGAMPDIGPIDGLKVTTPKGVIEVSENGKTIIQGVFAAGDVEMGPSSVVEAIGRGHQAAEGIQSYLEKTPISKTEEMVKTLQISLGSPICSHKKYTPKKIEKQKFTTFQEVEKTYSDFEAVQEASRCFTCGPCYACPICLPNCKNKQLIAEIEDTTVLVKAPLELSLEITKKGPANYSLKTDEETKQIKLHSLTSLVNSDYCIGCGRCEEVCAYRAIKNIVSKDKRTVSQVAHDSCASCSACVSECPTGAITQGYMSDDQILKRLETKKTPYDGIKGLMSYWSTKSPLLGFHEGIIELMSVRKPSPMFLIRALARTKKGLLVIKPDEATKSHYLPWEESPDQVLQNTWNLLKSVGISRDRIKYTDLQEGQEPVDLLKEFSKELDKKGLKKLNIPLPNNIKSPIGEAISILRIMSANPDNKPVDELINLPSVKKDETAYFEGCVPMIHWIGQAHNLYDFKETRTSIIDLFEKLKINTGSIKGLSCPSKGLLQTNAQGIEKIVEKINNDNLKAFKKANPKKIILATPEAFLSFSKEKKYGKIAALTDEILKKSNDFKDISPLNLTVAIHKACGLEDDPFYKPTKKLLELIPNVEIVELNDKCGQTGFENISGESKKSALNLMEKAVEKGAEVLICTSPYCQSHLLMCNREGSWRSVDVEISDIYKVLNSLLKGEN